MVLSQHAAITIAGLLQILVPPPPKKGKIENVQSYKEKEKEEKNQIKQERAVH